MVVLVRQMPVMRLLVCLDRTAFAQSILPVAQRFAAATNAEVELITVVAPNRHHGEPWSGQQPEPLDAAVVEEAQRDLASIASRFASPARVTVVEGQSAADAIVRHARTTRPDVIVRATHSRGVLGEAAPGSTARTSGRPRDNSLVRCAAERLANQPVHDPRPIESARTTGLMKKARATAQGILPQHPRRTKDDQRTFGVLTVPDPGPSKHCSPLAAARKIATGKCGYLYSFSCCSCSSAAVRTS